ncbi:MAG: 1-(5-phosphoribosyl)-5-[(5-phosphoribosylamino)methylideneamino]imidazole-4-carboxamide isomerase [Muribaculum sp.]|nr:1-(5-phosphoribosyl)-5-[(5-phosphoribosylamino)methylideneamino]imidazole-4-carboxamide isomerase [Muribaculum sp.]
MIQIIPAIDIISGKCVRLTKGDYGTTKVYSENPTDMARRFEDCGCHRLHLVDLDGAKSHHVVNYRVLESIASSTSLVVDFGGGIKSDEDVRIAFESGATMVTGGSVAVDRPELFEGWLAKYGGSKVILGADARDGKVATNGWLSDSGMDVVPFVEMYYGKGVRKVISTDITMDGTLAGPSIKLYKSIQNAVPDIELIASGGVGTMSDIESLDRLGLPGVIVGKAIYEGRITLEDVAKYNSESKC